MTCVPSKTFEHSRFPNSWLELRWLSWRKPVSPIDAGAGASSLLHIAVIYIR